MMETITEQLVVRVSSKSSLPGKGGSPEQSGKTLNLYTAELDLFVASLSGYAHEIKDKNRFMCNDKCWLPND